MAAWTVSSSCFLSSGGCGYLTSGAALWIVGSPSPGSSRASCCGLPVRMSTSPGTQRQRQQGRAGPQTRPSSRCSKEQELVFTTLEAGRVSLTWSAKSTDSSEVHVCPFAVESAAEFLIVSLAPLVDEDERREDKPALSWARWKEFSSEMEDMSWNCLRSLWMAPSDPLMMGDLSHSWTCLVPVLLDTKQGETCRWAHGVSHAWFLVPVLAKLCWTGLYLLAVVVPADVLSLERRRAKIGINRNKN